MIPVYATANEYQTLEGTPPADIDQLLARASEVVAYATLGCVYDVDVNGAPSDVDVADVFKRATCALVAEVVKARSAATSGEADWGLPWTTVWFGDARIERTEAMWREASGQAAGASLPPRVKQILTLGLVLPGRVVAL